MFLICDPSAPRKQDRLFMTHNKIYKQPVLKEIKEENKSENSESRSLLSKTQNSIDFVKKSASAKDLMMMKFGQTNRNIARPDQPANEKVEVIKVITSKLCQLLGINARFEVEEGKNELTDEYQTSKESIRVILDANNLQHRPILQQKNKMKKNRTMSIANEETKMYFQDQAGTTGFNQSDEKSAHLKSSDTYISKHNNQDSIENDEEAEMMISFTNDSNQGSNIGSLREMSVKTKENKDAYQNFSARKKRFRKPNTEEYKTKERSRQSLVDYPSKAISEGSYDSNDSVCCEGTATMVKPINPVNFTSESHCQRFNTEISSKRFILFVANLIYIGSNSKNYLVTDENEIYPISSVID